MAIRDSRESKADSFLAATTAADEVKPIIEGWVEEFALLRQGRRMAAYYAVASMFECSDSWIRLLIAGKVEGFGADLYRKIIASKPELQARRSARGWDLLADCAADPDASAPSEALLSRMTSALIASAERRRIGATRRRKEADAVLQSLGSLAPVVDTGCVEPRRPRSGEIDGAVRGAKTRPGCHR